MRFKTSYKEPNIEIIEVQSNHKIKRFVIVKGEDSYILLNDLIEYGKWVKDKSTGLKFSSSSELINYIIENHEEDTSR